MAQQAFALRACFSYAQVTTSQHRIVWRGQLQPTVASSVYDVEVVYAAFDYPSVRVNDPPLKPDREGRLPHFFHDEGTLCLHERHEWHPDMLLIETILPWSAEWLIYYEIWLATGQWFGDGDDEGRELHGIGENESPTSRAARRHTTRRRQRHR